MRRSNGSPDLEKKQIVLILVTTGASTFSRLRYRALFGCMVLVYGLVGGEFKIIALDAKGPVGAHAGAAHKILPSPFFRVVAPPRRVNFPGRRERHGWIPSRNQGTAKGGRKTSGRVPAFGRPSLFSATSAVSTVSPTAQLARAREAQKAAQKTSPKAPLRAHRTHGRTQPTPG